MKSMNPNDLNPGPDNYDFTGLATEYGIECNDGRTIEHGSFNHQDGDIVPIIYRHQHGQVQQVLGHGMLKVTKKGMRIYGKFAATPSAQDAKTLVHSGTLRYLSIFANKLKSSANRVKHGMIREVSLVIAGSNPGASIDNVILHSALDDEGNRIDDVDPTSAFIHSGLTIELYHGDDDNDGNDDKTTSIATVIETFSDVERLVLTNMVSQAIRHGDDDEEVVEIDVKSVYEGLSEDKRDALHLILGAALNEEIEHSDLFGDDIPNDDQEGEDDSMTHNVWEKKGTGKDGEMTLDSISHSDLNNVVSLTMNELLTEGGSAKTAFIQHAKAYGISNPELLFPEAKEVYGNGTPHIHDEDKSWVAKVMNGAHKSPFGKIRTTHNDMTESTARARGHIAEGEKWDEVFTMLRRETTEKMIYIRSKFDREDLIQITDFDALMYIKGLLRYKWDEEVAQAILISDGRAVDHEDKIDETKVRPVWTDDSLYTTRIPLAADITPVNFVDEVTKGQDSWYGSGQATLFVPRTLLTSMLLIKDMNGRRIYPNKTELAAAMDVKDIIAVTNFVGKTRDDGGTEMTLKGIMFNPRDYTIGANKGGKLAVFDQFDIDVNQQKYLMEAFISGAMTEIKGVVVFETLPPA